MSEDDKNGFDVNAFKAGVMRIDPLKQIFDLWYEMFYLRAILSELLRNKPSIQKSVFDEARKTAQHWMKDKFPNIDLDYSNKD